MTPLERALERMDQLKNERYCADMIDNGERRAQELEKFDKEILGLKASMEALLPIERKELSDNLRQKLNPQENGDRYVRFNERFIIALGLFHKNKLSEVTDASDFVRIRKWTEHYMAVDDFNLLRDPDALKGDA